MLYFAYGSNMNLKQMHTRCGADFIIKGPAKLDNYELGFDNSGYANIRVKPSECVWGVLFDITENCLMELDKYEGYTETPRVYDRFKVLVVYGNEKLQALVYFEDPKEFGGKPTKEYLEKVVDGAKQNNLPVTWIDNLKLFIPK